MTFLYCFVPFDESQLPCFFINRLPFGDANVTSFLLQSSGLFFGLPSSRCRQEKIVELHGIDYGCAIELNGSLLGLAESTYFVAIPDSKPIKKNPFLLYSCDSLWWTVSSPATESSPSPSLPPHSQFLTRGEIANDDGDDDVANDFERDDETAS